jgi:succinyl-CoA synthetase beta subunit
MARKKISEYKAKVILLQELGFPYEGISFDASSDTSNTLNVLDPIKTYVVKVDEGVKKRMKKGLVVLNKKPSELRKAIKVLEEKSYTHFLIEPFILHQQISEKYLSVERVREGFQMLYSEKGGIDVEENRKAMRKTVVSTQKDLLKISSVLGIDIAVLQKILNTFDKYHFSFLECNPIVIKDSTLHFLDIAAEVDSSGEFFVNEAWSTDDFREGGIKPKTDEEKAIAVLAQKSQASFKLDVLNSDGSLFMLLSGGGASIVLADEVYNVGFGKQLANYGEYSGNPNTEEVYLYTKNLLALLLKSKATKKVLIIGGGVANFTDIRLTFKGIMKAIDAEKKQLQKQKVAVFVRRGGPNQEEGLKLMEDYLKKNSIINVVRDQRTALPEIITAAVVQLQKI